DWLDDIANHAVDATNARLRKYAPENLGAALRDFFKAVDTNHNNVIEGRETRNINVRLAGYSLGGIQATSFARYGRRVGSTVKGFRLDVYVPVQSLVTLDPVNQSIVTGTAGVPENVNHFANYYQRKGGDTTVDLYTRTTPSIKVRSITVDDPLNLKGDVLPTAARHSKQIRVDSGPLADQTVTHKVDSLLNAKLKGKNVNHGTLPFFVRDPAVTDVIR
ncbi:MAG: hypothetical protein ACREJC_22430, partial [Tepidisphaeraceae bacterium]